MVWSRCNATIPFFKSVYEHSIYGDLTSRETKVHTVQNTARSRRSGSTFKTSNKEHKSNEMQEDCRIHNKPLY